MLIRNWARFGPTEMVNLAPDGAGGSGGEDDGDGDDGDGKTTYDTDEPTIEKVRAERNRAAKEARKAKEQAQKYKSQLDELTAWKEEQEEQLARKSQDFEGLEKQLKSKLEKVTGERDELLKWKEDQVTSGRRNKLVEAISSKTGIKNQRAIRAALREAAEDGIDIAPESPSEVVSDAVKAIKEISPELFSATSVGGSTSGAGVNRRNKKSGEEPNDKLNDEDEAIVKLAKARSTRRPAAQQQE